MRNCPCMCFSIVLAAFLLNGCPVDDDDVQSDDDVGDDDVGDDDTSDDDTGDDDTGDDDTGEDGPCGGGWGMISDPVNSIHVDPYGGNDSGSGTKDDPLETFQVALELSRQNGQPQRIALWPGDYHTDGVHLTSDDNGLAIESCGPSSSPEFFLDGQATFEIDGVTGVRIAGFALWGGNPALLIHSGSEVEFESVSLSYPNCIGMYVRDVDTVVYAVDVHTLTQSVCIGGSGVGFLVEDATAVFEDCHTFDSYGIGFAGISASLSISDCQTSTVAPTTEHWARGVHLEQQSTAVIEDSQFWSNWDTGIFSMDSTSLSITNTIVGDTNPEDIVGGSSGDGIVVTQSAALDPGDFIADLSGNEVTNSSRAGIIFDGVTAMLNGTTTVDGIYSQNGAVVTGTDQATEPVAPYPIDRTPLPF